MFFNTMQLLSSKAILQNPAKGDGTFPEDQVYGVEVQRTRMILKHTPKWEIFIIFNFSSKKVQVKLFNNQ